MMNNTDQGSCFGALYLAYGQGAEARLGYAVGKLSIEIEA
jgi:hypothetical protein